MELVTPNAGTIFWMIIIFGIVLIILKKFAWQPILSALKEREESIKNAMDAAQEARKEMDNLKAENESLLVEARREKEMILKEAMNLKENILAEAREKAAAETEAGIERLRQQIQSEKLGAVNDIKKQIAEISLLIAEKLIRKEMEKSQQQREMIMELIDEIKLN